MKPGRLIHQCCEVVGMDAENPEDPETLIGFFQQLRPRGERLEQALEGLSRQDELLHRLLELYRLCGDPRRPDGGKDVYFIIRKPRPLGAEDVEVLARAWLGQMHDLAVRIQNQEAVDLLQAIKGVRVLEGLPPKHPRNQEEWSSLLSGFTEILPAMLDPFLDFYPAVRALRPACYYIACDRYLRDYFLWPLYEHAVSMGNDAQSVATEGLDPFRSYFQLWAHGVKYRIFSDDQIDFYIPRR